MSVLNIAAYKFVTLDGLPERRASLKTICEALALKGTILLSAEGINLFLAGTHQGIAAFKENLLADPCFAGMTFKESLSEEQPFNRMLVKLKKEIISMGRPEISPATNPAPAVSPQQLHEWLSSGKDLVILDTRNDYEIRLGTFKNAVPAGIDHFRAFPQAITTLDPMLKHKTVVTICTGGIRCEKAAPLLLASGFTDVYQLEGGILRYFEEVGGAYYEGDCFVFDRRVALDPQLAETNTVQCFACLSPVTYEEQQLPTYLPDHACPRCSTLAA